VNSGGNLRLAVRHAISLLVHEQVEVVVDQCLNFETFAPLALIMIHVSPSATFLRQALADALVRGGCLRTMINPVSVHSAWGALTGAHLANVRALAPHCDDATIVSFHASNDMLLRRLPDFAAERTGLFEEREVSPQSTWYTGRQFGKSPAFADLLGRLGCQHACGSQIEGASYPYGLLAELADRIEGQDEQLARLPDASEEIIFSTWARCRFGTPTGSPYVLFRGSRLLPAAAALLPEPLRRTGLADLLQKGLNRIESRFVAPYATAADVDAVIAGRPIAEARQQPDANGNSPWYGIKRVARDYRNPLREGIRRHTLAQSATA